jgi:hypothetical protein
MTSFMFQEMVVIIPIMRLNYFLLHGLKSEENVMGRRK